MLVGGNIIPGCMTAPPAGWMTMSSGGLKLGGSIIPPPPVGLPKIGGTLGAPKTGGGMGGGGYTGCCERGGPYGGTIGSWGY